MPGLIGRAMLIVKSKFSRLLDRAENPTETLDYSYEEQLRQLQNVKRGIADVATAKKRLELQYTSMQQQVDKLDGQAKQALQANREDLAREALTRKAAIQGQLDGIMQQGQQLEAQQQKLIEGEQQLSAKVESFRTQKEVIKAQYSAAEAQVRIGEAATGIGKHMADVGLAVQRAKDKTQQLQARADAVERADRRRRARRLHRARATTSTAELAKIGQSGQVDDELAKLKAELGPGDAAKELPTADEADARAPDVSRSGEPASEQPAGQPRTPSVERRAPSRSRRGRGVAHELSGPRAERARARRRNALGQHPGRGRAERRVDRLDDEHREIGGPERVEGFGASTGIGASAAMKAGRQVGDHAGTGRSDRRVEEAEPAGQVLLDRELVLELRLQLELGGVVAVLALAGRDEGPEGAALEAVDQVDGVLAAVEAERRREQLRAEALRGQLGRDRVHRGHLALERRVGDDQPLEAEGVGLALDLERRPTAAAA